LKKFGGDQIPSHASRGGDDRLSELMGPPARADDLWARRLWGRRSGHFAGELQGPRGAAKKERIEIPISGINPGTIRPAKCDGKSPGLQVPFRYGAKPSRLSRHRGYLQRDITFDTPEIYRYGLIIFQVIDLIEKGGANLGGLKVKGVGRSRVDVRQFGQPNSRASGNGVEKHYLQGLVIQTDIRRAGNSIEA
jgi:hypothetical protein